LRDGSTEKAIETGDELCGRQRLSGAFAVANESEALAVGRI
jgi:hypothetical protein